MWYKAILGEGGVHCRKLCEIINEPLIEGMLVGTEKDMLTLEEREKVSKTSEQVYSSIIARSLWLLMVVKRANILQIEQEKYSLSASMLKQWLNTGIDALLMPVIPWVGYEPQDWVKSSQWVGYTGMWNLLNYASVTVPVAKADRALDAVGGGKNVEWEGHEARNKSDAFNQSQCRLK